MWMYVSAQSNDVLLNIICGLLIHFLTKKVVTVLSFPPELSIAIFLSLCFYIDFRISSFDSFSRDDNSFLYLLVVSIHVSNSGICFL